MDNGNLPTRNLEVDEIHVQVIVRELDENGKTIAKHMSEPIRFFNEEAFNEWASKGINISSGVE